jgi:nitrogen regulatory protein PII
MLMKKIETTVQPIAFSAVREALQALGINVITVRRAETIARRKRIGHLSGGDATESQSKSAVEIAVVVDDGSVARARNAIVEATRGETLCAGKILISHIDEVIDLGSDNPIGHAVNHAAR